MTTLSIQPPFPLITDIDGQPLEDGYIWIGTANLPPIGNPIAVYWDAALTQPAALPVRTRGGYPVNAGTPARLYVGSDYSILVQNKNGSTVYSAPSATERYGNIISFADITGTLGSDRVTFLQAGSGAVTRTAQAKMREKVSVLDFGADPTGVVDSTSAITAAIAALPSGGALFLPGGTYKVTGLTVTKPLRIYGDGVNSLIRGTGASQTALHIDGTGYANQMSGLSISDIAIATESGGGDCLKLTNVGRSKIASLYIPSTAATAAAIRFSGSSYVTAQTVVISQNLPYTAGTRSIPQYGVSFEDNGVTGIHSGHNTFITLEVEGCSSGNGIGIRLANSAAHNTFINGSIVVCNKAITINATSALHSFYGVVTEDNNTLDIEVSGYMCTFVNVQAFSIASGGAAGGIQFFSGSYDNTVISGRYRNITINSGALGTVLTGVSVFSGVTDNGTRTQQRDVWEITSGAYLPDQIVRASAAGSAGGMVNIRDAANNNRRVSFGVDNSLYSNGAAYVHSVQDGAAQIPLLLNPNGGPVAVGQPSAHPGGSNVLALAPAMAPTNNHSGITFYSTDGLTPKFMDKNGVVRTISFT